MHSFFDVGRIPSKVFYFLGNHQDSHVHFSAYCFDLFVIELLEQNWLLKFGQHFCVTDFLQVHCSLLVVRFWNDLLFCFSVWVALYDIFILIMIGSVSIHELLELLLIFELQLYLHLRDSILSIVENWLQDFKIDWMPVCAILHFYNMEVAGVKAVKGRKELKKIVSSFVQIDCAGSEYAFG